ncbi:hypothetical protein PTHTG4_04500 [Parageobacillus thermoglucosidasius]|nr:hypothetical protein PTHTG4_04500 [Parageobacillus thermoglucosidasius]
MLGKQLAEINLTYEKCCSFQHFLRCFSKADDTNGNRI